MMGKEVGPDSSNAGEFGDGHIARCQMVDYQEPSLVPQGSVGGRSTFQGHDAKYIDSIITVSNVVWSYGAGSEVADMGMPLPWGNSALVVGCGSCDSSTNSEGVKQWKSTRIVRGIQERIG